MGIWLAAIALLTWTIAHYATASSATSEGLTLDQYRRLQHLRDRAGLTNNRLVRVSVCAESPPDTS